MYVGHGRAGQGRAQGKLRLGRAMEHYSSQTERFSPELFFGIVADGVW